MADLGSCSMNDSNQGLFDLAVVEHDPGGETLAGGCCELSQSTEVRIGDRGARLDFDSGDAAATPLDHDVHLGAVLVPEVEEPQVLVMPARLASQFGVHEGLGQLPEKSPIRPQGSRVGAQQSAGQPRIADVQLGRLHQPLEAVAVPRSQPLQEEQPLEQDQVVADRRQAQLEGRRQAAGVELAPGLGGGDLQQPRQCPSADCNLCRRPIESITLV